MRDFCRTTSILIFFPDENETLFIFPHMQFCQKFQAVPLSGKRCLRLLDNRRVILKIPMVEFILRHP